MDKTYSAATYVNDITEIRESNKISYEDIELLTKYIAVSRLAGNEPEGRTYEEILEKIKSIRQANVDENGQAAMEKDAARERLARYLKVELSQKVFSKIDNKDHFTYTVSFQNLSAKNIKIIIGSVSINDLLDREIKTIQIVLDETLRANGILKKTYSVLYNHSNESDKLIRSKELVDLRIVWNPNKIIFDDGSIAE